MISFLISKYRSIFLITLILFGLYLTSLYSYLLFHTLTELFSIVVAGTIFVLAWNTQRYLNNGYLEFLGIAFLFVGNLDLLHTLAYSGMGIFNFGGTDLPTQLWIASRYLQSLSLLIAPVFLRRRGNTRLMLGTFSALFALLVLSIFVWRNFPTAYIEGVGLTPFKRASEFIIAGILFLAYLILIRHRTHFSPDVLRWLAYSILASIAAELAFADYINVYGLANLLGHLFKIIAFYLVYRAIIVTGLNRPHDLLFRDLKNSEEAARNVAQFPNVNPNPVLRVSSQGALLYTNAESGRLIERWREQTGQPLPDKLLQAIRNSLENAEHQEVELEVGEQVFAFTVAPFPRQGYANLYGRNITVIWRAEQDARFLAEIGSALAGTIEPEEAARIAVTALGQHMKAARCHLDEVDLEKDQLRILSGYHQPGISLPTEIPLSGLPAEVIETLKQGSPVSIADTADGLHAASPKHYAGLGTRAYVSVPLLRAGRWMSVLNVVFVDPHPWRLEEITLVRSVADRLWLALENARLFQDLRQSEQLYKAVQERLSLATEAARIGIWHWDILKEKLTWDDTMRGFFRIDPETEPTHELFLSFLEPTERARVDQAIQVALDQRQEYEIEHRIRLPGGQTCWIQVKGHGIYTESGDVLGMTGVAMDVTVRKEAEERLQRAAARDAALADVSRTISEASLDSQAVFEQVARRAAKLLGDLCILTVVADDGMHLLPVAVEHSNPEAGAFAQALMEANPQRLDEGFGGQVWRTGDALLEAALTPDVSLEKIKPEYRPYIERYGMSSLIAAPLRVQGQVAGILFISRDREGAPYTPEDLAFVQEIADRTALAAANARLYSEAQRELALRRRADTALAVYARQLTRSNRELQDFAFIASHDLQEPLRKILTFGDRLMFKHSSTLDEEALDYLGRMHRAAGRMQVMLTSLLEYSRVTTQAQPVVAVDLGLIVREVLADLDVRLEESGGRVMLDDLPTIDADPRQMQQLFQNLIGNALKFHRPDEPPVVKVYARQPVNQETGLPARPPSEAPDLDEDDCETDSKIEIVVADNGIGFNEKYLDRIFQPFQRLHAQHEYSGSGMGLAICRKIVERHRGSLTAQSRPGEGTLFIVTLPLKQEEETP